MLSDGDEEIRALAQEQLNEARTELPELEEELRAEMLERDPADDKDVIVELRAGTGGDEAALFAGDLYQMLTRYAESRGLQDRDADGVRRRRRRVQASWPSRSAGDGAYSHVQVRERRAPRAARAGRPSRRAASTRRPPPSRCCPRPRMSTSRSNPNDLRIDVYRARRPRRPVRQHDRLGRAHHAPAHRPGRHLPGRALAAPEQGAGDEDPARAAVRGRARAGPAGGLGGAAGADRHAASAARRSAPTTTRRTASPTTASASPCTTWTSVLAGDLQPFTDALSAEERRLKLAAARGVITLAEVLRRSTGYLEQHGSPTPRLDAELLLAHGLGLSRIELYTQFERPLDEDELAACRELVRRRGLREPVGLRDRQLGLPRSRARGRRARAGAAARDGAARRPLPGAAGGRRAPARRRRRHRLRRDRAGAQVRAPGRRGGRLRHLARMRSTWPRPMPRGWAWTSS